jgi:hypothetical protein
MITLKIFTNISFAAVIGIGIYQLGSQRYLIADEDEYKCCEDGDCRPEDDEHGFFDSKALQ